MHRLAFYTISIFFCLLIVFSCGKKETSSPITAEERRRSFIESTKTEPIVTSEKWGVEIMSLRMTAAGNMVDFRYRVIDPQKAADLFKRENKPYLIHHKSGKVLTVPVTAKVGPLRSSNLPKKGRIYWLFFGNKVKLVESGDIVTIKIGEFEAENIRVQ